MAGVRRRKEPQKVVINTNNYDVSKSKQNNLPWFWYFKYVKKGLLTILPAFIGFIVVIYINYPKPKLPLSVQFWRDSGYHFTYNNLTIFYQDIYRIESFNPSPVLLLIHGFPTSSYDWKHLIDGLQIDFGRIVAMDMIGFGFSDKPLGHSYSITEQSQLHEELLKHLKINEFHIIAHDMGDTVAQEFVARNHAAILKDNKNFVIKSLCLSNGGIITGAYHPRMIQKLLLLPVFGYVFPRLSNYKIYEKSLSDIFGPTKRLSSNELWEFYSILRYKDGNLILPRLLHYLYERNENNDRWLNTLNDVDFPVHFIYGPEDPINPKITHELLQKRVPKVTVSILKDAGHFPHLESPKEFVKSYQTFYKSIDKNKNKH